MKISESFIGVWIPAEIWLDENLPLREKCLLATIHGMGGRAGCYASNDYLTSFLQVNTRHLQKMIKRLIKKGLIKKEIQTNGKRLLISNYRLTIADDTANDIVDDIEKDSTKEEEVEPEATPRPKRRIDPAKKAHPRARPNRDSDYSIVNNILSTQQSGQTESAKKTPLDDSQFLHIAEKVASTVQKHKNVNITKKQVHQWSKEIQRLWKFLNKDMDRIENALDYLSNHFDDKYCPRIESGLSLRKKFLRLEDAMERTKSSKSSDNPNNPPSSSSVNHPKTCSERAQVDLIQAMGLSPKKH